MDELIAFITARLDEDEAAAKAAGAGVSGGWLIDAKAEIPPRYVRTGMPGAMPAELDESDALHIGLHDPARVLREIQAKRDILDWHQPEWGDYVDGDGIERATRECAECEPPGTPDNWPCRTVRALAAVWDGHPDYRAEWAP